MLAGGAKYRSQRFNTVAAGSQATMLILATIALFSVAAFRLLVGPLDGSRDATLSLAIAGVLLISYGCNLIYALITHSDHFSGEDGEGPPESPAWSLRRALIVLFAATAVLAWVSEILVEAVTPMTQSLGLTPIFVGVFVIAIFGVSAEFAAAIKAALRNRIDLSLSVAMGASVQISLFVTPTLIVLSQFIGPQPMDLMFGQGLVLAVLFTVLVASRIAGDGEADWLKGMQLLAVCCIRRIGDRVLLRSGAAAG